MNALNPKPDEIEQAGIKVMRCVGFKAYFKWLRIMLDTGYYIGGERFEDGNRVYNPNPKRGRK